MLGLCRSFPVFPLQHVDNHYCNSCNGNCYYNLTYTTVKVIYHIEQSLIEVIKMERKDERKEAEKVFKEIRIFMA